MKVLEHLKIDPSDSTIQRINGTEDTGSSFKKTTTGASKHILIKQGSQFLTAPRAGVTPIRQTFSQIGQSNISISKQDWKIPSF